ncbi:hypothetical protein LAZ67_X001812 [Cordylochernes scorpioides]|uniref:Reverse transcriptase domain-containing protein n=1 Tax=Cordylochernes scorpioides TaxID=51811 RepID=A0ABY6LST1_9ARAC|nr:hypothetical protein LAZ67_X001812 [Cordylochernes scorpioides]
MELNQYDGGGGGSQQANKRPRSEDEDLLPSSHHQFKFNSTANLFNFECQTFEAIIADTSLDSPEKIQMATKGLILTLVQEAELLLKDAFKGASLGRPNITANVPIPSTSFASVVAEKDKPVKPAPPKPKANSTFVNLAPSFESHVVVSCPECPVILPRYCLFRVDGEVRDDEICESFRPNHSVQSLLEKREIRVVHRSNNATHSTSTVFIEVDNQVAEILGQHGRIPVAGLVHRYERSHTLKQCFRCCGFGHRASACPAAHPICYRCGSAEHEGIRCSVEPSQSRCCRCRKKIWSSHNHFATLSTCPFVNAKKSPTVILEIANLANSTQTDIVLLQELSTNFFWPTRGFQAFFFVPGAYIPSGIVAPSNLHPIPLTSPDTAITSIAICLEQSIIVVHSAYWHGLRAADDFIPLLEDTIRRTSLPVILGMDTNAHSPTWGIGARLDFRGANLEEFASFNDFHFLGPPVDSTWSNGPLSSSIDVTLASSSLAIHVTRDMVNNETKSSWVESSCKEQTFKSFLNSSLHQMATKGLILTLVQEAELLLKDAFKGASLGRPNITANVPIPSTSFASVVAEKDKPVKPAPPKPKANSTFVNLAPSFESHVVVSCPECPVILPRYCLFRVDGEVRDDEICESFRSNHSVQSLLEKREIRVVHRSNNATHSTSTVFIEVDNQVAEILGQHGRIPVAGLVHRYERSHTLKQCFRCCGFGHRASACPAAHPICYRCGSAEHEGIRCSVNAKKSPTVILEIANLANSTQTDIVLLQELSTNFFWPTRGFQAFFFVPGAYIPSGIVAPSNLHPIPLTSPDTAITSIAICLEQSIIVVHSAYWHGLRAADDFIPLLEDTIRRTSLPVILGMDTNAHSPTWGIGARLDFRGANLEEFASFNDFHFLGPPVDSTWSNGPLSSSIDVTLASSSLAIHVTRGLLDEMAFTDHIPIWTTFLDMVNNETKSSWVESSCKEQTFKSFLNSSLHQTLQYYKTVKAVVDPRTESDQKEVSSAYWSDIHRFIARGRGSPRGPPLLKHDNGSLYNPHETCQTLLNHFFLPNTRPHPQRNAISAHSDEPEFKPWEVLRAIHRCGKRKALGPDGLGSKCLDLGGPSLQFLLAELFTKCLRIGHFPRQWKEGRLILLPKSSNSATSQLEKYRPITLLNTMAKVFERCILARLQRLADRHGWFFEDQYKTVLGTVNGRSAEDALASITQLIEERQAHWRKTLVISSDISKAFDTVWRPAIIQNLERLNCSESITCLVKSFLEDRTVSYSAWTATECTSSQLGTPQGSALSSFLWNIVARTIFTLPSIIDSRLIAYADDFTLMTQVRSRLPVSATNTFLERLTSWCTINGLNINPIKTQACLFQWRNVHPNSETGLRVLGQPLNIKKTVTILGVEFYQTRGFVAHLRKITRRCRSIIPRLTHTIQAKALGNLGAFTAILRNVVLRGGPYTPTVSAISITGSPPFDIIVRSRTAFLKEINEGNFESRPGPASLPYPPDRRQLSFSLNIEEITTPIRFTDGSKNEAGVGAAIVPSSEDQQPVLLRLHPDCTAFQAELLAIRWAVRLVEKGYSRNAITIASDCRSALSAISLDAWTEVYCQDHYNRHLRRIAHTPDRLLQFLPKVCPGEVTTTLLTGHGHVRADLVLWRLGEDPSCPHCMEEQQTVDHLLFRCPAFKQHRMKTALLLGKTSFDPVSLAGLPGSLQAWNFLTSWRMIKTLEKTGSLEAKSRSGRPSTCKSGVATVSQNVEAIETLSTYGEDRQALSEITFMQDGEPPHISRGAKQLLKDTFGEDRVISRHFIPQWPSRSPDLTPCDFWIWGYIKSRVYRCRPTTLVMLKASIRRHVSSISSDILFNAVHSVIYRLQAVFENEGRHIEQGLVVNGIGKKREAESNGQKFQVDRPRPVRTPATVSNVKRLATTENPPSQRQLSRMCGTSLKTINNIIHKDLELDTRRKGKVHKLTPFHMKNRATNARKLYEEHLAGSRSEYTATLDEAWMYVTYCNGIRKICYIKRGNQVPDNWVHQCSETFLKGFMVVGVMTGRGVLPLIKVPSKVKVNSEFYIECVLKPVIEQLKDLYPGEMDKVFLHHDKASSHTSNKTQQFLQEMKDTLGLNFIRNSDIPVKSPDASPLDFYGFGMLKQRLFNRRPKTEAGLWKAAQEEWSNVSLSKVKEVFAAWKVRCREIAKKKGKHIEHMKKIHVRKIKF